MSTPANAQILTTTCTFNAVNVGVCVAWEWEYIKDDIAISDDGSTFDDALGTVGKRIIAKLTFLDPATIPAETGTAASLVLKSINAAGATKNHTLLNMVPRNVTANMVNKQLGTVTCEFRSLGSAALPVVS